MIKKLSTGVLCFFLLSATAKAQADTLTLSIPQAEELFLKNNLSLLANHYNIDISKALVEQAKVWDNPVLATDQNIYDGKFFRHNADYGQVYVQVQQLIKTAGKIKKQVLLANDNVSGAQARFDETMRELRYSLQTNLINLEQLQSSASIYTRELSSMQTLVTGMNAMLQLGDISQKDNVRVKALLFSLQNDYADNLHQQIDIQNELRILLNLQPGTWIQTKPAALPAADAISALNIISLIDTAKQSRPDLQNLRVQSQYQQHNISLQKALAVPDVTLGPEYDHTNSYVRNYVGLSASLPIPLFNKNRGNIKAAESGYKQAQTQVEQLNNQVENEVGSALQKVWGYYALCNADNKDLENKYDALMANMITSYKQRQVSLLEFIDFFDAYKDTRIKQLQLSNNLKNAFANLNYTVNKSIIKL